GISHNRPSSTAARVIIFINSLAVNPAGPPWLLAPGPLPELPHNGLVSPFCRPHSMTKSSIFFVRPHQNLRTESQALNDSGTTGSLMFIKLRLWTTHSLHPQIL